MTPKKFIQINGIMKLNPEYKKWKESQEGQVASTVPNTIHALPVVTTMADYEAINQTLPIVWAESTTATMEILREPEICVAAGMTPDTMLNRLQTLFDKYEVPIGLVNKLLIVSEFDYLEFMMDDSGSMGQQTDALNAQGKQQSRWMEAQNRLLEMLEIVAHVPFTQIVVCFLNRSTRLTFQREGRDPDALFFDMKTEIEAAFSIRPSGTTPFLERLQESFHLGFGKSVSRYFFGDGLPNGGEVVQRQITQLLKDRQNPQQNPVSFLSCTNEDSQVEWMKDAEEVAPYCSESDDFLDEMREVIKDQGDALPFSKGFYLIAALVAAMNPHDLDAMDESVPFTKKTLDNLLGITHNVETYQHYFNRFIEAQQRRPIERDDYGRAKESDKLKHYFNWRVHYNSFLTAAVSKDIPAVQKFLSQLKEMDFQWEQSQRSPPGNPAECCCVM